MDDYDLLDIALEYIDEVDTLLSNARVINAIQSHLHRPLMDITKGRKYLLLLKT